MFVIIWGAIYSYFVSILGIELLSRGARESLMNFCTQLKAEFNGASRCPLYQGPG